MDDIKKLFGERFTAAGVELECTGVSFEGDNITIIAEKTNNE